MAEVQNYSRVNRKIIEKVFANDSKMEGATKMKEMGTAAGKVSCSFVDWDRIIKEKCKEMDELMKEFNSLEEMKAQLGMNKTKDGVNGSGGIDKANTSFVSSVMEESDKLKTPQSMYVQRNKPRRLAPGPGQYQRSSSQEKSEQTLTFTSTLEVEDVRRHITYRLNQEESKVVERWRCHSFGTTEGYNISFDVAPTQDSGLLAMDIQCLVYKGRRDWHKLWLNNNVVHCYGEILMKWAHSHPCKEYADFFISPYAGVVALAGLNNRDDLCWVKKLVKGYHNRLFLPCVINRHYILVVADCLKQKVVAYDSMNSWRVKKEAVEVGNWLRWVCATVLGHEDSQSWDFIYPKDIPQQVNGHDCGLFVLTYMASLVMCGSIVPFSTEEICGVRDRVLIELSKGQLVEFPLSSDERQDNDVSF